MAQGGGERLVGAVQLVVALAHLVLAGRAHGHAALISLAELIQLVVGQDQVLVLGVGGVGIIRGDEAERLLGLGHGSLEGSALGAQGVDDAVELDKGHGLLGQVGQIGVVVGGGEADGHAAGLVVGGDQDQGVVGVLVVEVDGHLDGVAHLEHVVDGSGGVVGVAGPVDLAGLGHHEEAVGVIQHFDALADVVGQLPLAGGGVDGVVHGGGVGALLGDDQGLVAGLQGSGAGLGGDQLVALGDGHVVVGHSAAAGVLEVAAGKVLKAAVGQLLADLVVVLAAGLMGVEGGGGGVVDVDGGQDADLVALLLVQLFRDGLEGDVAGPGGHVDDAGLGLFTGSDGGGGGSRVGAERSGVVGGDAAGEGELHEAQLSGDHSAVVFHRALIEGSGLDLGQAHAVADEQEDVLGGLAAEQAVQQAVLFSGGSLGFGSRSGGGVCSDQAGHRGGSASLQEAAAGKLKVFHNQNSFLSSTYAQWGARPCGSASARLAGRSCLLVWDGFIVLVRPPG